MGPLGVPGQGRTTCLAERLGRQVDPGAKTAATATHAGVQTLRAFLPVTGEDPAGLPFVPDT